MPFWAGRKLRRGLWLKTAEILTFKSIISVSQKNIRVTSEHFSCLLPAFESDIRCSRNGGPPVIWIISLYPWYQVYFVIITAEFLVTVLSITYLRNIFWGWTVPFSNDTLSNIVRRNAKLGDAPTISGKLKENITLGNPYRVVSNAELPHNSGYTIREPYTDFL